MFFHEAGDQNIFLTCVTIITQYHDLHATVKWQNTDWGGGGGE